MEQTAACMRRSMEAKGARGQDLVDQTWNRRWGIVFSVPERSRYRNWVSWTCWVGGGGAGFCEEDFMRRIYL
jgi:hypothetical protein